MMNNNSLYFWLFIFFLSMFILISNGRYGGDGLENYLTAESLIIDGDFFIYDKPFDVAEMRYEIRGKAVAPDKRVSSYGLGMALILVPFYLIGHLISYFVPNISHGYVTQFTTSLANPVILALLAIVLFKLLERLGYSKILSFWVIIIYSFCTMNIVYARSGFSEPTVALLILLAALNIYNYSIGKRPLAIFMTAAFVGYALFIKKNSIILLPPFIIYFFYILFSDRESGLKTKILHLISFSLPLIMSAIMILAQNRLLYGGLFITEYGGIDGLLSKVRTDGSLIKGLYYYLISPGKGFFLYNVTMLLGLLSLRDFLKKYKAYSLFISSLLVCNILFYSFIFVRGSLFSWGPRYLFSTLPLWALFLAEFLRGANFIQKKLAVIFFAILGFIIQLPSLMINFSKYIFFVKEKLHLPEYLINFMPELSPIKGAWYLFASALRRLFGFGSLTFRYSPDFKFLKPVTESLAGYDVWDIWWVNVAKVSSRLYPAIFILLLLLVVMASISFRKLRGVIFADER